jgi:hypothetical protein
MVGQGSRALDGGVYKRLDGLCRQHVLSCVRGSTTCDVDDGIIQGASGDGGAGNPLAMCIPLNDGSRGNACPALWRKNRPLQQRWLMSTQGPGAGRGDVISCDHAFDTHTYCAKLWFRECDAPVSQYCLNITRDLNDGWHDNAARL